MTISTAAVFLHRFYMRYSLKDYHYYDIGATSLFLATKCEETGRKLKDIVIACCKVAQKNDNLVVDEQSKEYWRWRDVVLYNEEILLEALCFDLVIDHPYTPLKVYWKKCGGGRELARCAWAFVNDSIRTTISLMYRPNVVAGAALYFAAQYNGVEIQNIDGKPWWEALDANLSEIIGMRICVYIESGS